MIRLKYNVRHDKNRPEGKCCKGFALRTLCCLHPVTMAGCLRMGASDAYAWVRRSDAYAWVRRSDAYAWVRRTLTHGCVRGIGWCMAISKGYAYP